MSVFCFECDKTFANMSSYNRHVREVHRKEVKCTQYPKDVGLFKCLDGCEISFKYNADLRKHLAEKHQVTIEIVERKFTSYEEFLSWLQVEEKENNVRYQKSTGTKKIASGATATEKIYYDCVRSGKVRSVSENSVKRSLKVQGSSKMNVYCTSQIIVTKRTDECSMIYFKNHYGHSLDIQHLRLSTLTKQQVASKLMMGVSTQHIIDNTRDNINEQLNRDDLLNKDDVKNIKKRYNLHLKDGYRHPSDSVSVHLWVTEMRMGKNNPVIFYKEQNAVSALYQNLKKDDFCLILMNNIQKDMLQKFGNETICIDSTHGLNPYDFELTTVLVVDEFGEGFPTAFMFSNRKDTYIMEIFFQEIIDSNIFMTDITNVFCKAWQKVMAPPKQELFCSWHIDRAWQQNLSKVSDKDTRSWIYKTLKFLQTLVDSEEFEKGLKSFLHKLKSDSQTSAMYTYIASNYAINTHKWAHCYRKNCFINTNMHIESMHKVIKYAYLDGRKVRRLDKSLNALQKLIRDKIIDRIIKLTKGKSSDHIRTIEKRHRSALSSKFLLEPIDDTNCILKTDTDRDYLISKTSNRKCCELSCSCCKICIHMYNCTCTDFFIKHTICVHIHFLCLQQVKKTDLQVDNSTVNFQTEVATLVQGVSETNMPKASATNESLKNEVHSLTSQISNYIKNKPVSNETLKLSLSHIRAAAILIPNEAAPTYTVTNVSGKLEPGNTKIEKQEFFSTKKKSIRKNQVKKPNENEKAIIKEYLSTSLCTSSNPTNDHMYT